MSDEHIGVDLAAPGSDKTIISMDAETMRERDLSLIRAGADGVKELPPFKRNEVHVPQSTPYYDGVRDGYIMALREVVKSVRHIDAETILARFEEEG